MQRKPRVRRGGLALVLVLAAGCATEPVADTVVVRLEASAQRPLAADAIHYTPSDNVRAARLSAQGSLSIERRDRSRALTVSIPQWCPVIVPAGPQRTPIDAREVIDLGRDRPAVGFDTPFTVTVRHGCAERGRGRIEWRQLEGAPLAELSSLRDGFELHARMPPVEQQHWDAVVPGIVPFSPRTQGRVVLEALWRGPGAPPIRRQLALVATSRATGLSSVAVSQQLMLAGTDWRVQKAPPSGHAQVHPSGGLFAFTPDAPGSWTLAHSDGQTLVVQALWHDKTPADCGRSECHASIAETTRDSPMSSALERHLESTGGDAVGCMLDCHVLGERGAHDGGFLDVAAQLGFSWLAHTRWEDLPQPLRRLGGVRCTACHGPGVLPERQGRELVLRSDVCASCHDAPPRYVHVEQWRASSMARADVAPGTRAGGCAGCHTTSGFLERVAGRSPRARSLEAAPVGIACAACHAPHDQHRGARLVRTVPVGTVDDDAALDASSALCLACHAPAPEQPLPSAPSGALWQGQARVPAADGNGWDVLRVAGAHRQVPRGCVGCHGAAAAGAQGARANLDHSFRVEPKTCTSCHVPGSSQLSDGPNELAQRARALAQALARACRVSASASQPAHASAHEAACDSPRQTRALYEVQLVLQDRAALVHNGALARALLQDAQANASPGDAGP